MSIYKGYGNHGMSPPSFEIMSRAPQLLMDVGEGGRIACEDFVGPRKSYDIHFVYIFCILENCSVSVTSQLGVDITQHAIYGMEDAIDLWAAAERLGWKTRNAGHWYRKQGNGGFGVVPKAVVDKYRTFKNIKINAWDLSDGFYVLGYEEGKINSTFSVRRREIVTLP